MRRFGIEGRREPTKKKSPDAKVQTWDLILKCRIGLGRLNIHRRIEARISRLDYSTNVLLPNCGSSIRVSDTDPILLFSCSI